MAKTNPTTVARLDTKKALPADVLAIVAALDPSKENREIIRSVLGSIFHGSMRRDPAHAMMIAKAAFGLSGSSGEKYAAAFFYAKDGAVKPFDGTPTAVVQLAENLADLRTTTTRAARDLVATVRGTSYEENAQKKLDQLNKLAGSDTAARLQAKVNGVLVLMAGHIEQCREWVKSVPADTAPAVEAAKPAKKAKESAPV